jgi:hypothetical protein
MGYIILDPAAVKQLEQSRDAVELRDELGRVIGTFRPAGDSISSERRAELEERRKVRSGRPLDEVLKGLRGQ